jgi:Putative Zn-dependent protease
MKKFILLICIAVVFMGCAQQPKNSYTKEVVTVHAGDTLWDIANRYNGKTYILEYLEGLKSLPENKEVLQSKRLLQPGDKVTVLKIAE